MTCDTSVTSSALDHLVGIVRQCKPGVGGDRPVLIGEGISTLAYGLSSPDGEWVLRVSRRYPTPWTWRGGRGNEVALLAELRGCGVPVPDEAMVIEKVDGLPTAILERRVAGTPLTPEMVRDDTGLTIRIAEVLDRLHSVDVDGPVGRGVPRDDPVAAFRQALATVGLDGALRRRVEAAIRALEARMSIRALCHRDFRVGHLIVDAGGELVGLLDLGDVGVDDPAIDLAFLYGDLGAAPVAQICAAMETADPDLNTAARTFYSLWPLLELLPGGDQWGDPDTARDRLESLV